MFGSRKDISSSCKKILFFNLTANKSKNKIFKLNTTKKATTKKLLCDEMRTSLTGWGDFFIILVHTGIIFLFHKRWEEMTPMCDAAHSHLNCMYLFFIFFLSVESEYVQRDEKRTWWWWKRMLCSIMNILSFSYCFAASL